MKRLLPFLLALLLLLPCLAACKTPPAPDTETGTNAPDITPTAPPLVLVKDGASEYVIVRPADITAQDPAFIAAVLFRDTVENLTGVALQIVTDDENAYAVADKEIVIGNARGAAYAQSAVYVTGSKLFIGGQAQLLSDMVTAFFKNCFDYDLTSEEVKQMTELSVPADFAMDQAGTVIVPEVKQDATAWGDNVAYADKVANLVNFRYLDQKRDIAEITNGDMRLVYNLDIKDNKQVAGLYNKQGAAYLTNTMDAFVVADNGEKLYASMSGPSARGNIYRFGYYYYDIHFLDQGFLPSSYSIDESAGSYDLLAKARKINTHDIKSAELSDGVLTAVVDSTTDPYFHWSVKYNTEDFNALQITMRTQHSNKVTLYFHVGNGGGFNGDQLTSFSVDPGKEFCTVIVPLEGIPNYTDKVNAIRVDCGDKAGEVIEIKEMKAIKITTTSSTNMKLDRNYHVYGDKMHEQIRVVADGDTKGFAGFGAQTKIEA
ncbi:MAG: hypothetical protein J6S28_11890, partial [Clostridia bacterium]|nr:hypothetical protein [Clostridia bacterium]